MSNLKKYYKIRNQILRNPGETIPNLTGSQLQLRGHMGKTLSDWLAHRGVIDFSEAIPKQGLYGYKMPKMSGYGNKYQLSEDYIIEHHACYSYEGRDSINVTVYVMDGEEIRSLFAENKWNSKEIEFTYDDHFKYEFLKIMNMNHQVVQFKLLSFSLFNSTGDDLVRRTHLLFKRYNGLSLSVGLNSYIKFGDFKGFYLAELLDELGIPCHMRKIDRRVIKHV